MANQKSNSSVFFSPLALLTVGVIVQATGASSVYADLTAATSPATDPCAAAIDASLSTPDADFMDSSHAMRVMTMCEFRDAVVSQYSNYDLKSERLPAVNGVPFNPLAHLNQCIAIENAVTSDDSDLHFLDRVSQCVAGFHDTHFWTGAPVSVPPVFAGLMVRQIGGKYYISQIMPDVINYLNQSITGDPALTQALVVGNEVTEVDGQSPAALSAQYATYISGSSTDFVNEQADESIFERTFDYPTKNTVEVKITDGKGNHYDLQLPWWGGLDSHTRLDAMQYFQSLNIPISDRVKIMLDPQGNVDWRSVTLSDTGYDETLPLFPGNPLNPLLVYNDDTGLPGLRVGEIVGLDGDTFCYMELLTFDTVNFTAAGTTTTPAPTASPAPAAASAAFGDTIRGFISQCKAQNLNLVLDLRSNPGGNGDFPDLLLSILTEQGKTYQAPTTAFRITSDTGRLLSADNFYPEVNFEDLGAFSNNPIDIFNAAAAAGQKESPIIPNVPLGADSVVGGYPGKILALVTPNCVSACDMTAALLKKSGRATLFGTHSNGTGAGFLSAANMNATFQDSNDELMIKIPNFLFGVPNQPLDPTQGVAWTANENSIMLENRPTEADVQYSLSLADLNPTSPGQGLQLAVLETLKTLAATQQQPSQPPAQP